MKLNVVMAQKAFVFNLQNHRYKVTNEVLDHYFAEYLEYKICSLLDEIDENIEKIETGHRDNGTIKKYLGKKNRAPMKTVCCGLMYILEAIKQGTLHGSDRDVNLIKEHIAHKELLIRDRIPGLSINNIGNTIDVGKGLNIDDHKLVFLELIEIREIVAEIETTLCKHIDEKMESLRTTDDFMCLMRYTSNETVFELPETKTSQIKNAIGKMLETGVCTKNILLTIYNLLEGIQLVATNVQTSLDGHMFLLHDGKIYTKIANQARLERRLSEIVDSAIFKYGIQEEIQCNSWEYVAVTAEIQTDETMRNAIQLYLNPHVIHLEQQQRSFQENV